MAGSCESGWGGGRGQACPGGTACGLWCGQGGAETPGRRKEEAAADPAGPGELGDPGLHGRLPPHLRRGRTAGRGPDAASRSHRIATGRPRSGALLRVRAGGDPRESPCAALARGGEGGVCVRRRSAPWGTLAANRTWWDPRARRSAGTSERETSARFWTEPRQDAGPQTDAGPAPRRDRRGGGRGAAGAGPQHASKGRV